MASRSHSSAFLSLPMSAVSRLSSSLLGREDLNLNSGLQGGSKNAATASIACAIVVIELIAIPRRGL
ncbi:hypothetical protein E2562_031413 [Oryza meyeriana var. granulata]|uniref:Uncharacterized protein n=1 Tax=Oryza meyeriana var. granulata TaxID=110450 RepID=A0A6G1C0D2_9ORYZ|nr:hypothetical protein E2562_031413 [Oryza meyeriana var. granulata]